ncbi:MAG TPA: acyloxyacyl hydrolase [Fimbriimonas sp.]|nr:acyloxyacyl hydrolase [Fimbriimonas sp.]
MKSIALLAACLAASASYADEVNRNSHYFSIFLGDSAQIIGSEDVRYGGGVSYGFGRPEPRFDFGSFRSQLVYEGYADVTRSLQNSGASPDSLAVGVLALGRWFEKLPGGRSSFYFDIGWGLQVADTRTYDLPSETNSTPVIGIGFDFSGSKFDTLVGIRFLHISNANLVYKNRGQDEFFLTIGARF